MSIRSVFFFWEKFSRYRRVLVVPELFVSGTQCTRRQRWTGTFRTGRETPPYGSCGDPVATVGSQNSPDKPETNQINQLHWVPNVKWLNFRIHHLNIMHNVK